jgi:hypothetical protein
MGRNGKSNYWAISGKDTLGQLVQSMEQLRFMMNMQ